MRFDGKKTVMIETIQFTLNDRPVRLKVDSQRILLWALCTDLGITGSKYGCGEGPCGACTVLVNNVAEASCQTIVKEVREAESRPSSTWGPSLRRRCTMPLASSLCSCR